MAEVHDKESKTEEATEKRLQDAIEKGNIPFSKEAASFASLGGILTITGLFLAGNVIHLRLTLERFIDNPGGWSLENGADVIQLFHAIGLDVARLLDSDRSDHRRHRRSLGPVAESAANRARSH